MTKDTVVMIMAGGRGSRLGPITCHRSKPAVPFGGRYRIIDFVLSNFVNSGYRRIYMLTQYMVSSLIKHLNRNWRMSGFGEYIEVVPAQMRMGEFWYRGTADAVFQNLNLIRDARARHVAVFSGDHVYKLAVDQMEAHHRDMDADLTVAAIPVPIETAHRFGVIEVDATGRVVQFHEKPANPPCMPGQPHLALASMGNYFFRSRVLEDALAADFVDEESSHDFGKDIIPRLVSRGARVFVYDFTTNRIPGESDESTPYWRDVGTIDSYFEANMDLRARVPALNLYNRIWRIHTAQRDYPPARFVRHGEARQAEVDDSLVCEGSIIASATLRNVVLGYDCFVHAGTEIEESVILAGSDIGANCRLRRVLLDKNCKLEPGTVIGHDPEADKERFPFTSEGGIVVIPKGTFVPRFGPMRVAFDVDQMLRNDPDMKPLLRDDMYQVARSDRHSHVSAGPRYRMFEPGADSASLHSHPEPDDD